MSESLEHLLDLTIWVHPKRLISVCRKRLSVPICAYLRFRKFPVRCSCQTVWKSRVPIHTHKRIWSATLPPEFLAANFTFEFALGVFEHNVSKTGNQSTLAAKFPTLTVCICALLVPECRQLTAQRTASGDAGVNRYFSLFNFVPLDLHLRCEWWSGDVYSSNQLSTLHHVINWAIAHADVSKYIPQGSMYHFSD